MAVPQCISKQFPLTYFLRYTKANKKLRKELSKHKLVIRSIKDVLFVTFQH